MLQDLVSQETPWPLPPQLTEEEEQTVGFGYSFEFPNPSTGMVEVSPISSEKNFVGQLSENSENTGFPSDNTDTEAGR